MMVMLWDNSSDERELQSKALPTAFPSSNALYKCSPALSAILRTSITGITECCQNLWNFAEFHKATFTTGGSLGIAFRRYPLLHYIFKSHTKKVIYLRHVKSYLKKFHLRCCESYDAIGNEASEVYVHQKDIRKSGKGSCVREIKASETALLSPTLLTSENISGTHTDLQLALQVNASVRSDLLEALRMELNKLISKANQGGGRDEGFRVTFGLQDQSLGGVLSEFLFVSLSENERSAAYRPIVDTLKQGKAEDKEAEIPASKLHAAGKVEYREVCLVAAFDLVVYPEGSFKDAIESSHTHTPISPERGGESVAHTNVERNGENIAHTRRDMHKTVERRGKRVTHTSWDSPTSMDAHGYAGGFLDTHSSDVHTRHSRDTHSSAAHRRRTVEAETHTPVNSSKSNKNTPTSKGVECDAYPHLEGNTHAYIVRKYVQLPLLEKLFYPRNVSFFGEVRRAMESYRQSLEAVAALGQL